MLIVVKDMQLPVAGADVWAARPCVLLCPLCLTCHFLSPFSMSNRGVALFWMGLICSLEVAWQMTASKQIELKAPVSRCGAPRRTTASLGVVSGEVGGAVHGEARLAGAVTHLDMNIFRWRW
jgi:hypothetical protein